VSTLIAEKALENHWPFAVRTNVAGMPNPLSGRGEESRPASWSLEPEEHAMREMIATSLDHILHHIKTLPSKPVNDASRGRAVAREMREALPESGASFESLLHTLFEDVIPTSVNTASPGDVGYIPGGGIFPAALADFIAKSVNRHVGYYYMSPAIVQLEWNVIRWFCDMVGYGTEAGGVLTSGGSMATLTAIIAARTTRLPEDFQRGVIYLTTQTHYSVAKAALLAGFPEGCLRMVPVDESWRMNASALQCMIEEDRAAGLRPFMVVGTAGTTNTGAVDPLCAIADIAERENLWVHVDAAYGGFFMLTAAGGNILAGLERADSITLDPHKGLCLPYGTGALLARNLHTLKQTYSARADYLPSMNDVEGEIDFCGLSPELSRDWRGLRVWLPLKMHGAAPFRENLNEKLALARKAELALRTMPNIEVVAAPQLSVLAFRLVLSDRTPEELDALNQRFLEAITRRQRILLSSTRLNGRFSLRLAVLSFRTHEDRILEGLEDIRDAASEVLSASEPAETIHGRFERQASSSSERVALISGDRRVTFGALDKAANVLAAKLQERGLRKGGHVGVFLSRSVEAVTSILAVLKAGGVYVPIDPNDPPERQRFIIRDGGVEMMICAGRRTEVRGLLDRNRIIDFDELAAFSPAAPVATYERTVPDSRDRPIYLLYTSGSTGRPKGVIGLQGATLNRLVWMWREFPFASDEVYLHRTALTFVDAVWEILGPLLKGVPLVVLPPECAGDPDAIGETIRQHRVTRVTAVPSILDALVRRTRGRDALSSVRVWISSGERLQAPLLARVRAALPEATVLNLYGSTEVAGDVTCAVFPPGGPAPISVPIGKAISNARLFVLDENRVTLADDEEGELYVGGPVIARGYHRRREENAARFVTLPHLTEGPVFRTGDRVRRDAQGELYYVGRNDRQVKVRGVRIELDEVESALMQSAGNGVSCAVVARPSPSLDSEGTNQMHVAAYVAPKTIDIESVRRALAAKLPAGMMPAVITALDALPLLPNGKIDRQALQSVTGAASPSTPAANVLQEQILSIWARLLPSPPTSIYTDIHLLGGDSLTLVEFVTEMESALGRAILISDLPQPLTVAAIAQMIERSVDAPPADSGIAIVPASDQHRDELLELLAESFSIREPMAAALQAQPADLLPFARALLTRCASEPFSYVAIERHGGRVMGFCLGHDFAGPGLAFDARRDSPKLTPLFDLLARLHRTYEEAVQPRKGRVLEIAATGAAADADGYTVARALERRAMADARARGFEGVVSLCTNSVTRYLALADQGGHLIQEVPYDTFEHEGRRVFGNAARHRGVALIEGHLA